MGVLGRRIAAIELETNDMKMSVLSVGRDSTPLVLGGKRTRAAADDEAFLDNFHTHKRYLTEVRAVSSPSSFFFLLFLSYCFCSLKVLGLQWYCCSRPDGNISTMILCTYIHSDHPRPMPPPPISRYPFITRWIYISILSDLQKKKAGRLLVAPNPNKFALQVMASSLNGLKVGEATSNNNNNPRSSPPLLDAATNVMMSPAHTETAALSRSASSFPTSHGYVCM